MQKFKNIFLQNRDLKQKMFKNIFWLSVSQISRFLRTITLLYSARILGAEEYGAFSYILGVVGIFSIFSDLGINALITRDAAGDKFRQREYFATGFWIKTLLAVFTSVMFWLFAPYVVKVPYASQFILLGAFLMLFDNLRDFLIAYLRGMEKMEKETLIVTILNVTLAISGFLILMSKPTAKDFFFIYTLSSLIATLFATIITRNEIRYALINFKKSMVLEIFKNGWPIAVAGIFGLIMSNIDIFILGIYHKTNEIGLYSAGQKIIQVLYLLPTLLASGVFPGLAYIIKQKNLDQEKNLNEKSIGAVLLFTIPLVVGGIILADPIFKLLFGHEYTGGIYAFMVLLVSTLIIFPGIMITNLVLAHNEQRALLKFTISASILNVVLGIILIPKHGIMGAAVASFFAQIINYVFAWHKMKKVGSFEILPRMKKVVVASIFMGVVTMMMQIIGLHVLINVFISVIIYFSILFILKEELLREIEDFLKHGTREEVST